MIKIKNTRLLLILLGCMLISCDSEKKIVYMQDAAKQAAEQFSINQGIVVQPKDVLSIVVSSREPALAIPYNLPLHSYQAGSTQESSSYSQRLLGYMVDMDGNIDFPQIGELKVAGKTREQVSEMIRKILRDGIIEDATVNTEFMNFRISVMGEVQNPGIFDLKDDRITLLEALSRAGDLTIYGRRDNVLVRREQNGNVNYYQVDLLSVDFTRSPAFYLQQNDVVYVSPNKHRSEQSNINENRSLSVWIALASFLTSMAILIFR